MGKHLKSLLSFVLTVLITTTTMSTLITPVNAYNGVDETYTEPPERYTILVLDVSSPSSFYPNGYSTSSNVEKYVTNSSIEEVKESAKKFLEAAKTSLSHNHIAIVTYAEDSEIVSEFTDDMSLLDSKLEEIQEKKEATCIAAGLVCARKMMEKITDDKAVKNVLLCTTGHTDFGDYEYYGVFNSNTEGSSWETVEDGIKLYAYANVAIEASYSLQETNTTVYVVGLFRPIESAFPDKSSLNAVANLFRMTAQAMASSPETYYPVDDIEQLEFTFEELQYEMIGSSLVRLYNNSDSNLENAIKETEESAKGKKIPGGSLHLYGCYEDVLWGAELFEQPSTQLEPSSLYESDSISYNLAMISGCMCTVADDPFYLHQAYLDLGFKKEDIYFYSYKLYDTKEQRYYNYPLNRSEAKRDGNDFANDDELAFSIASQTLQINGEDTDVLFIVARGTSNLYEAIMDGVSKDSSDFYGYTAWDVVWEFEEDIFAGLADYYNDHPYLGTRPLKILVTGHSLGGGAANLVAAKLCMEVGNKDYLFCKSYKQDDVFAFTFGALNSISNKKWGSDEEIKLPIKGFENIINIFNYFDTFGPHGPGDPFFGVRPAGGTDSFHNKFGRFYTFADDMNGIVNPNVDCIPHQMVGYLQAVKNKWVFIDTAVKKNLFFIRCPVDITVMQGDNIVCQIQSDEITQIDDSISAYVENSEKVLIIPQDDNYRILISATDFGNMDCFVQDLSVDSSSFNYWTGISLETDKTFMSLIPELTDVSSLDLFVTDKDGNNIAKITHDGKEVDPSYIIQNAPDPTPTPEPTPTPTPTPVPISYEVVSGGDTTLEKRQIKEFNIVVERSEDNDTCFDHFEDVKVDGSVLELDTDYKAVAGSTRITLNKTYLRTLEEGKHTILIVFDDGEVSTTVTVQTTSQSPALIIAIGIGAVVVIALLLVAAFFIFKKLKV